MKKLLLLMIMLCGSASLLADPSDDFFAQAIVHTFKIQIDEDGVASLSAQHRTRRERQRHGR